MFARFGDVKFVIRLVLDLEEYKLKETFDGFVYIFRKMLFFWMILGTEEYVDE
jgi:hypothetical protein